MAITIAKIPTRSGFKYKAHVKKNGKNFKVKIFTRKTDARIWVKRIEADFELMEALGCKGSSLTLSQLADEYLGNWSGKDANQAPRVAFWVTVLGRYNLVDITATVVREALEAIATFPCKQKKGKSVKKVK